MNERSIPTRQDIAQQLQASYKAIRKENPPEFWRFLKSIEKRNSVENPKGMVTPDLITLLFLKPEISMKLQQSAHETKFAFFDAVANDDPSRVQESVFFIEQSKKGLIVTKSEQKPAAYDIEIPEIKTSERDSLTIAGIHTHPPFQDVLAPSTVVEHDDRLYGDLIALAKIRQMNIEASQNGESQPFSASFLSIILQEDFNQNIMKILFVQEGEKIKRMDENSLISYLREKRNPLEKASDEAEVQLILKEMGYRSAYLEIPSDIFYSYPPIDLADRNFIIQQLNAT